MSKYKCKNHWNYRVVTKIIPGQTGYDLDHGTTTTKLPDERVFSITEVYYHKGKPNSYIDSEYILSDLESLENLKWAIKKIKKALKKPILDLDNFPKKWKDDNIS